MNPGISSRLLCGHSAHRRHWPGPTTVLGLRLSSDYLCYLGRCSKYCANGSVGCPICSVPGMISLLSTPIQNQITKSCSTVLSQLRPFCNNVLDPRRSIPYPCSLDSPWNICCFWKGRSGSYFFRIRFRHGCHWSPWRSGHSEWHHLLDCTDHANDSGGQRLDYGRY